MREGAEGLMEVKEERRNEIRKERAGKMKGIGGSFGARLRGSNSDFCPTRHSLGRLW